MSTLYIIIQLFSYWSLPKDVSGLTIEVGDSFKDKDTVDGRNPYTPEIKISITGRVCDKAKNGIELCKKDITNAVKKLTLHDTFSDSKCEDLNVCHIFYKPKSRTKFEVQCYNQEIGNSTIIDQVVCRYRYPYEAHAPEKWTKPRSDSKRRHKDLPDWGQK